MIILHINYRVTAVVVYQGWVELSLICDVPPLFGRYCSYLLTKQDGWNTSNISQPDPGR